MILRWRLARRKGREAIGCFRGHSPSNWRCCMVVLAVVCTAVAALLAVNAVPDLTALRAGLWLQSHVPLVLLGTAARAFVAGLHAVGSANRHAPLYFKQVCTTSCVLNVLKVPAHRVHRYVVQIPACFFWSIDWWGFINATMDIVLCVQTFSKSPAVDNV